MAGNQYTKDKEKRKKRRVVVEIIILLVLAFFIAITLFTFKKYKPYEAANVAQDDKGFIALSYFGVDRIGDQKLIGEEELRQQLQVLKDRGYVTIIQKDIEEYYHKDKKLPEKSLFLLFEDGRRDTGIFAQKILEQMNYKGTICTYPEKFANKDLKFLRPSELKTMEETTFWELGTNGYRLAFINVFDRYDNYLGNMNSLQYSMLAPVLGRKYNHYLMDYIRDAQGYPTESQLIMRERIEYDYRSLAKAYTEGIGAVPGLSILMHANTGSFGNNPQVAAVNGYWLQKLFKMNFNREGYCKNVRNSSIYDLTRMEPQAYWPVNHLLTRINDDTNQQLAFVKGDNARYDKWVAMNGAAEMHPEKIILTTATKGKGLLRLKKSGAFKDIHVTVNLLGNKFGGQNIYLRAADGLKTYVSVGVVNNFLVITDKSDGHKQELLRYNLDRLDGIKEESIDQDRQKVLEKELETFTRYAKSASYAEDMLIKLEKEKQLQAQTIPEGSPVYTPRLSYQARGKRQLDITLSGKSLIVKIDGKQVTNKYMLAAAQPGAVYLESTWAGLGWSQGNLADDVYDGIFAKFRITDLNKEAKILYSDSLSGGEYVLFRLNGMWKGVVAWAIRYL